MKKLIENFIIIMVLTIAILFSYALIEKNKWTQQFGIYKFPLQYAGKGFQ